jgi:hypothetical protein
VTDRPIPAERTPDLALTVVHDGTRMTVYSARGRASEGPWTVLAEANRHSQRLAEDVLGRVSFGREVPEALPSVAATVLIHHAQHGSLEVVTGVSPGSGIAYAAAGRGSSGGTEPTRWILSNHLPSLLPLLPTRPNLDERALARYLLLIARDHPPYEGVEAVPAGSTLHLSPGKAPQKALWFVADETPRTGSIGEFVEEYCAGIDDVMRAELPEAGDVSALMSAGLDSTMVVGTAAGLLASGDRRIAAHCLDPFPPTEGDGNRGHWLYSDLPDAKAMGELWPNVEVIGLRNDDRLTPIDTLPPRFAATGLPVLNPDNSVWMDLAIRRAAAAGHEVILNGQSGNRVFSYEPSNAHFDVLMSRQPGVAIDAIRERADSTGNSVWWEARVLLGPARRPLVRASAVVKSIRTAKSPDALPLVSAAAMDRLGLRASLGESPFYRQPGTKVASTWRPGALTGGLSLPETLTTGVRTADPLAAEPLVRIVARLPPEAFIGVADGRSFARRTMVGRVPDQIRLRRNRGMQASDQVQWYTDSGRLAATMAELAADERVARLIDVDRLVAPVSIQNAAWVTTWNRALGIGLFIHHQA